MATTQLPPDVLIQGSQDINQLNVKAHSTQTQPLETWQNNAGNNIAQVTGDGRLEIGNNNLEAGALHDAVMNINQDASWLRVWQVDASPLTYVDETTDANSTADADWQLFPTSEAVGDYVAIGYYQPFRKVIFNYANGTAGVGGVLAWEFWNGSTWADLETVTGFSDTTSDFTAAAADGRTVSWTGIPTDWTATSINGSLNLFYIRARVTTVYSTNPVLDQGYISATSGTHSLGRITGTISSPTVNWTVDELRLNGTGGVSGLHVAKKVKLTHNNTGTSTTADLRGTDSSAVNTAGSAGAYVGQVTGVKGTASNAPNAYLTTAAGVEATVTNDTGATVTNAMAVNVATPTNTGTITNLYGLKIPDLTQGTNNYSVYTGTASSYFGGQVQIGNGFKIAAGAISNYVLTSDASGVGTWQAGAFALSFPIGSVQLYGGSTAPTGWFFCDGSAVNRTTYAELFNQIGTTYGAGDGSTTFNLPDLRGRAAIGVGQGSGLTNRTLAQSSGTETHTLTIAEMPSHNHLPGSGGWVHDTGASGSYNWGGSYPEGTTGFSSSGSGSSHNNMQPWLCVNFIIKT